MSFDNTHETLEQVPGPNHPYTVYVECMIGIPCCGGCIIRMNHQKKTFDLSERNEDRMIRAVQNCVRQAFAAARGFRLPARIADDGWEPGFPPDHPSHKKKQ